MNLWDNWKGLLSLLMIGALTFSCKDDENTIGLPVENALNLKYLEYDVPVEMVWLDSTRSDEGQIYIGRYETEDVGVITSVPYITFRPQGYNVSDTSSLIPANAIFDSLVLNLHYNNAFDNNTESTETFKIYHLDESIPSFVRHYTYEKIPYSGLLGEKTFTYYPDSLEYDKLDSIDYIEQVLLDPSFGHSLLDKLQSFSTFKTQNEFEEFFPGIAVESGEGNVSLMSFSQTSSEILLYFTYTTDEGEVKQSSFRFSPTKYFNNITPNKYSSDLSGTSLANLSCCNDPIEITGDYVYQIFGTGINLKLDLSAFKNFADTLENPIINSAVLEIGDVAKVTPEFPIASGIAFYLTDDEGDIYKEFIAGTPVYYTLSNERTSFSTLRPGDPAIIQFDDDNVKYSAGLSLLLQYMIEREETPGYNLVLELANVKKTVNSLNNVERSTLLLSAVKIPKNSIKIKIYYSTLN